jgi:hypothetical protein
MKKTVFGCWGHAFNRKILYTDKNGKFYEFMLPGGAALIRQLLSGRKLTECEPLDKTFRREHFELKYLEDKQDRKGHYAIGRYLGFTEGGDTTPLSYDAKYAIVSDEGLGTWIRVYKAF